MKSALGNTFIVNFIIIFTVVFIGLFVGSLTYTKALRIKNRITDIIEENGGYTTNAALEIEQYLSDVGYRISKTNGSDCKGNGTVIFPNPSTTSNYDYCIFEHSSKKGNYYGVKTYMYLDLPIIGDKLKIGVYGETKTIGILE